MINVGIFGIYPGVKLVPSLFEVLNANDIYPTYFSNDEEAVEYDLDFWITLAPGKITISSENGTESTVNVKAEVFGSGAGLHTAMIRGFLRTGVMTVYGAFEAASGKDKASTNSKNIDDITTVSDEYLLIEQEMLAQIVMDTLTSYTSGNVKDVDVYGQAVTTAEFAKQLWESVTDYIKMCEMIGIDSNVPPIQMPEVISRSRKVVTVSESNRELSSDINLSAGIETTLYRLLGSGDIPPLDTASRYYFPEWLQQEPRHGLIKHEHNGRIRTTIWHPRGEQYASELDLL